MSSVYFIQDEASGLIKIGYASKPWQRLHEIQVGCPGKVAMVALEAGGADREAELHSRFDQHRARGEWFKPTQEILDYAAGLGEPQRVRKSGSRVFWNGWSDVEVAAALGVSRPMLSLIRAGKRRPSPEWAIRLQRLTGVSAIKLAFGDLADEAA